MYNGVVIRLDRNIAWQWQSFISLIKTPRTLLGHIVSVSTEMYFVILKMVSLWSQLASLYSNIRYKEAGLLKKQKPLTWICVSMYQEKEKGNFTYT